MTKELANVMFSHNVIIGRFFDAEQALDTKLTYDRLTAETHKDYYPSDSMCRVGSYMRSIARTEQKSAADKQILAQSIMRDISSQLGGHSPGQPDDYIKTRIEYFKANYCEPADYQGRLVQMCTHENGVGALEKARVNMDIDYTKLMGEQLTIDVNFSDDMATMTDNETDITALARHLYWGNSLPNIDALDVKDKEYIIQESRSMLAPKSVAIDSFASLASDKFSAPEGLGERSGWNYMKAMMREMGLADQDIHDTLGNYPSYYAQMDVLTKRMYQNPDFYTNLYDKPANIERISASLDAIALMQLRDYYHSKTRQEILLSNILQTELKEDIKDTRTLLLK